MVVTWYRIRGSPNYWRTMCCYVQTLGYCGVLTDFLDKKFFFRPKILFGNNIFFGTNIFLCIKIFLGSIFFQSKLFFTQYFFGTLFIDPKLFSDPIFFLKYFQAEHFRLNSCYIYCIWWNLISPDILKGVLFLLLSNIF